MPRRKQPEYQTKADDRPLGIEATLWQAADKLRSNMDAAEYKHVVLGLLFLKYISDAFEDHRATLQGQLAEPESEYYVEDIVERQRVLEDRDEYLAENVFWVPAKARWAALQAAAKQPDIGERIDGAMQAIEAENPTLRHVLPVVYARPNLDKRILGELIDLLSNVGLGGAAQRARDLLGRVYEYFLGQFADAEGKKGGQFYTPRHVVQLLVAMLAPYKGRVYDPCCGSGGMFVQSEAFIEAHGGRLSDISIYGQESNHTTWRLCKMNLAIRGIEADLGPLHDNSFHHDLHPDLRADYVLANPPFNDSDWGADALANDVRWKYGLPPAGNANYAWIQHFVHHLAPNGVAGFVMANGAMSSQQSGEGDIRRRLVEADLVDCVVALPGQLFYNTAIPVCLWFLARDRQNGHGQDGVPLRDRRGETLFLDARELGQMVDRRHRALTPEEIARIADTYHAWRGDGGAATAYADLPGFCKSATLEEMRGHDHILTPGRYVGFPEPEEDDEAFEQKLERLRQELEAQFAEGARLEAEIRQNLDRVQVAKDEK